ncbi:MAG TPA: AraC family transcriptional regulator [Polyangiales bacterium]|nr:AraC family transcriptional regulator [Polyangiales bacterium]
MATITASYLLWIADYGASRGVATASFLRGLGLSAADGERRIAIEHLYAAWELVAHALRDPALPILYAERLRIEDHHVLGFAAMSAPTLAEALRTVVRFAELASDSGSWRMEEGSPVRLVWQRPGLRSLGLRLANEAVFCELVGSLRQIVPGAELAGVSFRHPRPSDQRPHLRFFQAPITWSAGEDAITLDRTLLSRVPASENPRLMAYFADEAERRRAELVPRSVAAQVTSAIGADLSIAPAAVARRLGLSGSGLREHLKREGTSFRGLLDTARRERAAELLQAGERSISEIALLLGFSETSAFTRAYTRWHGVPPRQHRART